MTDRRLLIRALLSGAALAPWASLAVAQPNARSERNDRRFAFVILRGGLDGLTAVPAVGDPDFAEARGLLGRFDGFGAGASAPLPLGGPFALHPLLPSLHAMYGRGELAVLHAVGLPYRERSHFDAQQVLESGGTRPYELATGWLGRALQSSGGGRLRAVALETAVPLVLRGAGDVDTWAPSTLPEPAPDLVARLELLYRHDPALAGALQRARILREDGAMGMAAMGGNAANATAANPNAGFGRNAAVTLAQRAAEFLQRGSQVAVLELGGWDSHANQAAPNGATSNNLRRLDAMLAALRDGLLGGGTWDRTAVLVATEFGREVQINGTQGTDHGTGGAAFVLGGAVRGGRVVADWPGLARSARFEGRDLRITTDLRAALRPLLGAQLQVASGALDGAVLPGSAGVRELDLLRG